MREIDDLVIGLISSVRFPKITSYIELVFA